MRLSRSLHRRLSTLDAMGLAIRSRIGQHLPLCAFVVFFVATVGIGNLLFLSSYGEAMGASLVHGFATTRFRHFNTPGFWALLVLPLVVVPPLAVVSERLVAGAFARSGARVADVSRPWFAEIHPLLYVAMSVGLHGFCLLTIERQSILPLLASATDIVTAVDVRFAILQRVGFPYRVAVNSLLPFLVVYAFVRSVRSAGWFWRGAYAINIVLTSVYLTSLNMKWPILVFWLINALAVYALVRRHVAAAVLAASVVMVVGYLGIAAFVLHIGTVSGAPRPRPAPAAPSAPVTAAPAPVADAATASAVVARQVRTSLPGGFSQSGSLLLRLPFRMAVAYPYYFEEFTDKGSVCGTVWDRVLRRPSPCAPSTYIYAVMSPLDRSLHGRGTAPAAVNIAGYALGGWPVAVLATVLGGLVLAGFAAVGRLRDVSPMHATVWIMGVQVAYFLTQLPFEASLVYDHGALWWAILILVPVQAARTLARALRGPSPPRTSAP